MSVAGVNPHGINPDGINPADVRARIEAFGIMPAIRVASAEDALFAAQALLLGGIGIVELTMTVPGAVEVIAELARSTPALTIGAGTVLDLETARRCLDAGAAYLTGPALDLELVEFGAARNVLIIPGALTPTEVQSATRAGIDLIKIYPCAQVGGPGYIKALKAPFPHVALIASGGVNQTTAVEFIRAGAVALGIGEHLIPAEAVRRRNADWIRELSGRFLGIIREARVRDKQ
jgi:2-dehydro-3-deoxyphosphogluconate aldolase/(4S)-4-hydroxy-2-oxoglutarate aldolase